MENLEETKFLLTESEAAKMIGVRPTTLAVYRRLGEGPPYIQISKGKIRQVVRYQLKDLESWVRKRKQT